MKNQKVVSYELKNTYTDIDVIDLLADNTPEGYKIDCFNLIKSISLLEKTTNNLIVIYSEIKSEKNITLNIQEVVGNEVAKILTDTIKDLNDKQV